jgi:hypothetical protein
MLNMYCFFTAIPIAESNTLRALAVCPFLPITSLRRLTQQ